ncbi:MAG: hypothetical protein ACYC3V_18020, partial [Chloroflexota bacterium]
MDDIGRAKPLDLLDRYRLLCENVGACRATDTELPKLLREQLESVEAELQSRLSIGSAEGSEPERASRATSAAASAAPTARGGDG